MSSAVRDNPGRNRFELELDGGLAFVTYSREAGVRTLLHAEVPRDLEGRGHGSELVKGTLDLIRAGGEKVIPRCPFIDAYMRRHKAYDDLRVGKGDRAN